MNCQILKVNIYAQNTLLNRHVSNLTYDTKKFLLMPTENVIYEPARQREGTIVKEKTTRLPCKILWIQKVRYPV